MSFWLSLAEESSKGRMRKKLLRKSSWFRSSRKEGEESQRPSGGGPGSRGECAKVNKGSMLKTKAVLFLEQTPYGELANRIKEELQRLEPTLVYKKRMVERAGRSITSLIAQTSIWGGEECGKR